MTSLERHGKKGRVVLRKKEAFLILQEVLRPARIISFLVSVPVLSITITQYFT